MLSSFPNGNSSGHYVDFTLRNTTGAKINLNNLSTSIQIQIPVDPNTKANTCRYFNTSNLAWQTDGCQFNTTLNGVATQYYCQCTHTTQYTVTNDITTTSSNPSVPSSYNYGMSPNAATSPLM
jgi:hypothetical protein